ncbi:hypothetical protein H632_c2672p0, partial [Helicosporidium sp. ATCC 50920]
GRWKEAAEALREALALEPHSPGALAALGFALHLGGNVLGAVDAYHASLALDVGNPLVSELLAEALQDDAQLEDKLEI